jgi:hypothetical protein
VVLLLLLVGRQASVVEVQIPINVQSDLKQWKQEVEDIKKKKGGHVHGV